MRRDRRLGRTKVRAERRPGGAGQHMHVAKCDESRGMNAARRDVSSTYSTLVGQRASVSDAPSAGASAATLVLTANAQRAVPE